MARNYFTEVTKARAASECQRACPRPRLDQHYFGRVKNREVPLSALAASALREGRAGGAGRLVGSMVLQASETARWVVATTIDEAAEKLFICAPEVYKISGSFWVRAIFFLSRSVPRTQ